MKIKDITKEHHGRKYRDISKSALMITIEGELRHEFKVYVDSGELCLRDKDDRYVYVGNLNAEVEEIRETVLADFERLKESLTFIDVNCNKCPMGDGKGYQCLNVCKESFLRYIKAEN